MQQHLLPIPAPDYEITITTKDTSQTVVMNTHVRIFFAHMNYYKHQH